MENLFEVNEVRLSYKTKQRAFERPKIKDSMTTYHLLLKCFDEDTIELKESFKVLLLNCGNKVLRIRRRNIGDNSRYKANNAIGTIKQCKENYNCTQPPKREYTAKCARQFYYK